MALLDDILADLDDEEPKKKVVEKENDPEPGKKDKDRMEFRDDDPDMPPKDLKKDQEPGTIQFCKAFLEEFGDR